MSLKGDKYETAEEVQFRLNNTVVMYDGEPVYIVRTSVPAPEDGKEVARVFFQKLPILGKKLVEPTRKFLSSKKFDLTPFKMGYFNHNGRAFFVSRAPIRQNQQGLNAQTCVFNDVRGKIVNAVGGKAHYDEDGEYVPARAGGQGADAMSFSTMLESQGFVDMVNGKYPSFQEVGALLDDKENASIAVSRSFAFHIDHDLEALLLMHRGVKCGIALKGEKYMRLPPKFHFLKQEAEQCRIPLA